MGLDRNGQTVSITPFVEDMVEMTKNIVNEAALMPSLLYGK